MARVRSVMSCRDCGQQLAQWAGRCPGCGAWGTIEDPGAGSGGPLETLEHQDADERRVPTGLPGVNRVLGGGLVPRRSRSSQASRGSASRRCSCSSWPGSRAAGSRASSRRARSPDHRSRPGPGASASTYRRCRSSRGGSCRRCSRPLARCGRPSLPSTRSRRSGPWGHVPGPGCADALVGLAKAEGISVLVTGHVTKDGDLAGPRTLEHAVDTVLSFEGDPGSGRRMLSAGKNRFGAEGEVAWFEMTGSGLAEIDPGDLLRPGAQAVGAATALPLAGRRALAVEVQALIAAGEMGTARRQVSGLDPRRFQLVAAVLESVGLHLGRADAFGATAGGARLDDPAADLATAAALASASCGVRAPPASAFVGEIALTGVVRPAAAMAARPSAAEAAGLRPILVPEAVGGTRGIRQVPVRHVLEALEWAAGEGRGFGGGRAS